MSIVVPPKNVAALDWLSNDYLRQDCIRISDLLETWVASLVSAKDDAWLFPAATLSTPMRLNNLWRRNFVPKLKPIGLTWATFQVMRRSFATFAKQAEIDAHTRCAHMVNSVDVNENEYAVSSFEARLATVRKLESAVGF